jgi:hypothetical protein
MDVLPDVDICINIAFSGYLPALLKKKMGKPENPRPDQPTQRNCWTAENHKNACVSSVGLRIKRLWRGFLMEPETNQCQNLELAYSHYRGKIYNSFQEVTCFTSKLIFLNDFLFQIAVLSKQAIRVNALLQLLRLEVHI